MCVVTRNRKERSQLVRITKTDDVWLINQDNKLEGRSIYLDLETDKVLEKFTKQQRRFKINDENMKELICELTSYRGNENA